jgi:hypothetical protein
MFSLGPQRCFFRIAHPNAAHAKKSAFLGRFGNVLADLTQPALECTSIAWRLGDPANPQCASPASPRKMEVALSC